MEERFVWVTTRRIEPGKLEEFERAWRPGTLPDGLRHAYAYWSEDGQEITGVSLWDSRQACDAWRSSDAEKRRREVMAPYVVEEREGFYRGGELTLPAR
ncbi:antibiotic biosynthesis monooxygenase [Streptomyces sp. 3211.6]|uniref:putative quinol monooxygenase n=1 Tax=Streptomyces TaxID=1883 RepID=UPI0009A4E4DA|nr:MULTISPECIES: antibiotic biosynthesis monooxygenase [Streptomyces]RKT07711.1 antibiotic biosynthesis monooxygenase [Streptomyces sp. 3211.6]RPF44658.1 antibiotic biosynthesis monooxygenase [Streptomyces sp. Ag109_G2-6]